MSVTDLGLIRRWSNHIRIVLVTQLPDFGVGNHRVGFLEQSDCLLPNLFAIFLFNRSKIEQASRTVVVGIEPRRRFHGLFETLCRPSSLAQHPESPATRTLDDGTQIGLDECEEASGPIKSPQLFWD